ncbi:hypothetical protein LSCM1_07071 [Leishmania martiniquensis]|uniref:CMP/dCMP-type deaminase domain-containing protein n=1 Tax=Leishmania martiniquensis TaxID=1580590 RepID=A0A836HVF9_9TRYP|nr:hypothetical protein LSCM1_07071 [Leishmania martiniquensis]
MSVHYVDAFMRVALNEAELALTEGEVPVGCVLVRTDVNESVYAKLRLQAADAATGASPQATLSPSFDGLIESCIAARGRNQTNRQHHALAHAEFIAAQKLMDDAARGGGARAGARSSEGVADPVDEGGESVLTSAPLSGLAEYVLYVTVEPCVMCGAMLLYNCIAHVFFGCCNARFGGNGTVLALHTPPLRQHRLQPHPLQPDPPEPSESRIADTVKCLPSADESGAGYSGGWWPGYVSEGGHTEAEAIRLLQRFYERENPNAPDHKRRRKA